MSSLASTPAARRLIWFAALLLLAAAVAGCASNRELRRHDFSGTTMAVIAAMAPRPVVLTGYDEAWVDLRNPVRSAARVGTALAKAHEAEAAQRRLDSAFVHIDVAARMAARSLARSAPYLGYTHVADPAEADYVMDVRLHRYGILADSWDSSASFFVDGELLIVDNDRKRLVWKQKIHERELITGSIFGLGMTAGNVLTARALANLSTEEMIVGLEHMADHTADAISRKLQNDYLKARE